MCNKNYGDMILYGGCEYAVLADQPWTTNLINKENLQIELQLIQFKVDKRLGTL